jgi:hypothetical protein
MSGYGCWRTRSGGWTGAAGVMVASIEPGHSAVSGAQGIGYAIAELFVAEGDQGDRDRPSTTGGG